MRYDSMMGWLLTKEEYIKAGFTERQFKRGRNEGAIPTTSRACRTRQAEIIFKDLPERIKGVLIQKFTALGDDHEQYMRECMATGSNITETAIRVTEQSLRVNMPFIASEIGDYIEKNHHRYLSHYIKKEALVGKSIVGYARICALATWLHAYVMKIMVMHESERDRNRMLRSLRANVLSVLESVNLGVKIPTNDIRFAQWLDRIITEMNQGKPVTEVITIKGEGNTNTMKLTPEQQRWIESFWIFGNAITIKQLYDRMVEAGRYRNWWRNRATGDYEPVTYGTVYGHIKQNENRLALGRTDLINYRNNYVATINRRYPEKKNECWGIDGTAHNLNVFYKGKVKQFMYAVKVYDYATARLLHNEITIGMDESAYRVIEALKGAIRSSGYLPRFLQCDRGPAYEGLKAFCEEVGIHLFAAGTGRARAKMIEPLIGQFDQGVRFEPGWSGMNRTAIGPNAQPGDAYFKAGKANAKSLELASRELRGRLTDEWNNHIIETREGHPCGKTPAEMWNEFESDTPALPHTELAMLTGFKHTIKLTIEGIRVQHDNREYLYFPPIETEEQRVKADEVLARIPLGKKESSQCDIYITEYGKPAPVLYQRRYIGTWAIKETVPYCAGYHKETEALNNARALQDLQERKSKEKVKSLKDWANNGPDAELFHTMATTPYVGRTRVTGRYEKSEFNASEIMEKAGVHSVDPVGELKSELEPAREPQYKTYVDPDTGEIKTIRINNL